MAKLNQIIAIEKGVKARVYGEMTKIHQDGKKRDLFDGLVRTYQPLSAAPDAERLPPERKYVQLRYKDILAKLRKLHTEGMNITARREWSNTVAKADLVVDGEVMLRDVPIGYLLYLEKQLLDLATIFSIKEGFVTLDESEVWHLDANDGLHKTEAVSAHRTKKNQKALVLLQPTEHHPGQAVQITEDETVGHWNTIKQSGAIPRTEKEQIAERVEKLLQAVRQAREAANGVDESEITLPGQIIYNYLYGG